MIFEKIKELICEQFDVDPERITEDTNVTTGPTVQRI